MPSDPEKISIDGRPRALPIQPVPRSSRPASRRVRPHPLVRTVEPLAAEQTHRDSRQEVNRLVAELLGRS